MFGIEPWFPRALNIRQGHAQFRASRGGVHPPRSHLLEGRPEGLALPVIQISAALDFSDAAAFARLHRSRTCYLLRLLAGDEKARHCTAGTHAQLILLPADLSRENVG